MRLSVCIVIVGILIDGILGMKHGVAAFVIQFFECYFDNAAACCCRYHSRLVNGTVVVRDRTDLRS